MTEPDPRSQHPTDILIRELIATRRAATPQEVSAIVERMATAEFDRRVVRVAMRLRGLVLQGEPLGARAPSLELHIQKRIRERQWADGTTAATYLADLRYAVTSTGARLAVYRRRGGHIALAVTPTTAVIAPARLAGESLPGLAVFYSADRGTITSGYQFSTLDQLATPEDIRWLT